MYVCLFTGIIVIREHELRRVLSILCSFYYLVGSTACFVHMLKIQVIAERVQKIQSEVKEIRKVFFCDLCNKQYKLAVEFEAHLSSYDHNHRKVKDLKDFHMRVCSIAAAISCCQDMKCGFYE